MQVLVSRKEKRKRKSGDSIIRNIHSCSLNQSLKEFSSVLKPFPGATTPDWIELNWIILFQVSLIKNMCNKKSIFADLAHCIKPSVAQKLDMVILHARRNNLRSDQTLSGITNRIIKLARVYRVKGLRF